VRSMQRKWAALLVACVALYLATSGAASAAEVTFTAAPTAVRDGAAVRISFAVSAPTDVEVAVLDGRKTVVRHLAAGVLGGKNAPPGPLKPGLAQEIAWDLKDDFGKPAGAGPWSVRVRAGLGVKFGGFVGGDPYTFGSISSIATDEGGNLYVMANGGVLNQRQVSLRVFDPRGRYLREILPFPADLKPEAVKGVAQWDAERGAYRLANYQNLNPLFYPAGQDMRLVSASRQSGIVITAGTNVYRLGLDGGNFAGPFPMWSRQAGLKNPNWNIPQLAVSPDGRYIYYANVAGTQYDPKSFADTDPKWPQGRVYRQDTAAAGANPEPFFDLTLPDWNEKKYWLPNAWNCRTAAFHVVTDPQGHVHVCDLVNQEIVEVGPDGKKVAATKVAWPERVHVDAATGAYYVLSRLTGLPAENSQLKLVKIVGRGAAANVAAELPLKVSVGRGGIGSCLGKMDGAPAIWIGAGGGLLCVKDAGAAFELVQTTYAPAPGAQLDWNRLAVDYERNVLYANNGASDMWRYDGLTGQGGRLMVDGKPFYATDLAVGYDGLLYVRRGYGYQLGSDYSGPFERYTRDFQPAPFPSGSHVLSGYIYSRYGIGYAERGIGVGPDGTSYISFMFDWCNYCVAGFGPDGKALKGKYLEGRVGRKRMPADTAKLNSETLAGLKSAQQYPEELTSAILGPITAANAGLRVDWKGDIYIGLWARPLDDVPPPGFEKDEAYQQSVGSVFKFTPAGGFIAGRGNWGGSDQMIVVPRTPGAAGIEVRAGGRYGAAFVEGAIAAYPGLAPFSHDGWAGNTCCVCRVARFDLDRFGRLVMPNAITNSIRIVDNAGNLVTEFGAFGNFDSQYVNGSATRPTVAVPSIPLGWPTGAGVTADHVYVNDTYNRRVVRTDLIYAAEAACDVK
jgi:hypothetical protein